MRISDWSSDVCSSDLDRVGMVKRAVPHGVEGGRAAIVQADHDIAADDALDGADRAVGDTVRASAVDHNQALRTVILPEHDLVALEIGRVACRERVGQYV